MAEKVKGLGL